jgi:hypothetical protein
MRIAPTQDKNPSPVRTAPTSLLFALVGWLVKLAQKTPKHFGWVIGSIDRAPNSNAMSSGSQQPLDVLAPYPSQGECRYADTRDRRAEPVYAHRLALAGDLENGAQKRIRSSLVPGRLEPGSIVAGDPDQPQLRPMLSDLPGLESTFGQMDPISRQDLGDVRPTVDG